MKAKSELESRKRKRYSQRAEALPPPEPRQLIADAVTKMYLSLSMCEHGNHHPEHAECRATLKKHLRTIREALDTRRSAEQESR